MLTVESPCGLFRATVEENDDGFEAKYYRSVVNDGRGYEPGTKPPRLWKLMRSTQLRVPGHVALDTVLAIVRSYTA